VSEIPGNLPDTAGAHPTEQCGSARAKQGGEIYRQRAHFANTVQSAEVGEGSVKEKAALQTGNVFGGDSLEAHGLRLTTLVHALGRDCDHARRVVAGENVHASAGEEAGINSCAAADFEYAVAGVESFFKLLPDGGALGLTDSRGGEDFVVAVGDAVEWSRVELRGA
jgi:hypothetical protein